MLRKETTNKSFTVLELLIVIAIIGILASVIYVRFKGASERARISNAMQFADTLRASLQADMVAWWTMDKIEGGKTPDNFFNQLHGTISGTVSESEDSIANGALEFSGGRVNTPLDSTPENMTFSGWFKKTTSSWGSIAFLGKRYGNSGWMLYRNAGDPDGYFRWYMHYYDSGMGIHNYYPWPGISDLSVDRWYHFAVIRRSNGASSIYVDGKMIVDLSPPGNFYSWITNGYGIGIGAERANSGSWNCTGAIIDEVQIYSAALPPIAIQQLYAQGRKTHLPSQVFARGKNLRGQER